MQRFIKGRTNNHLTWVMVDATDFATPESALSASTKIKIYGKLTGAAGVNFVSSGSGSLTNDIQHVGASVLGIYTIALAKADLSDASAAWYDQYIISLSATGAAYQALIVDGGILESYLSAALSDTLSAAVALSDAVSNAYSAAVVGASRALLAQSYASDAYSAAIIIQSRLSDFDSRLVSDVSDIRSMLTYLSDAVSNVDSAINSQYSDLASKIGAITATVSASDISDIASAVWANTIGARVDSRVLLTQSFASDAASAAVQGNSRTLLVQSRLSDFDSRLVSDVSDIRSMLTYLSGAISDIDSATNSQYSDLASKIGAITAAVSASDISDIASAVWANTIGARVDSRVLLTQSFASDAASAAIQGNSRVLLVQSRLSDFDSRLVSDVSDIRSMLTALSGAISDIESATDSQYSDLASKIGGITAAVSASDISDIASAVWANTIGARVDSRVLLNLSRISDVDSAVNSQYSDLASKIGAITVALTASDISDIASGVIAGINLTQAGIAAAVWEEQEANHVTAGTTGRRLREGMKIQRSV